MRKRYKLITCSLLTKGGEFLREAPISLFASKMTPSENEDKYGF